VVALLLDRGADHTIRDHSGLTPLANALRFRHRKVMELLLARAAQAREGPDANLLEDAVLAGQTEIVDVLLTQGADPNRSGNSGATPLHNAALKGHIEIARILLDHGAKVNVLNSYGGTPLHDAALSGHAEIAQLLLLRGAEKDARDTESGATPLYQAASMGREAVVELLPRERR